MGADNQKGFTLIELLIVLAVIGILSGLAIPLYQDYISRSQLARVYFEIAALKVAVEHEMNSGQVPASGSDVGFSGSSLLQISSSDGLAIVDNDGVLEMSAVLGGDSSTSIAGVVITLYRSTSGDWTCEVDASSAGAWKDVFLPSSCSLSD